jgi:hypothetical protein
MEKKKLVFECGGHKWESQEEKCRWPKQAQQLLDMCSEGWVNEIRFGVDGDQIKYILIGIDDIEEENISCGRWRMYCVGTDKRLEESKQKYSKYITLHLIS